MQPVSKNLFSFTLVVGSLLATHLLISSPVSAKKYTLQIPVQDKLSEGSGPTVVDDKPKESSAAGNLNLSPVGLNEEAAPREASSNTEEPNGVLKSSVTENKFVAKDQAGAGENPVASGKAISIFGFGKKTGLGDKVLKDNAKKVEVAPLALMASDEESDKKNETTNDAEKLQLADLWNSTMSRNPDIQFVINKLQPTENANHAMATTMKALSAVLYGAMNSAPMMFGGYGTGNINIPAIIGVQGGGNVLQGLFASKADKEAKKHAISQEQATILYKMVRDTADKLVSSYRDYKKDLTAMKRADDDLKDLQSMVAEARGGQDASKQIEMEYTLRKARRDIDKESAEARQRRLELVDLAGDEAVAKLDQEMQAERLALDTLTGSQSTASKVDDSGNTFVNPLVNIDPPKKTAVGTSSSIQ